jgi:hypothetical protein
MARKSRPPEPAPEPAPAAATPARWVVSLPYSPTLTVEAADADAAWAEYRRRCGLLGTVHTPTVRRADA